MCEEMALTHLQQTLRSLCFKSEWKYAVFWKLKHRARMMLTWEDAYYANNKPIDSPDQMSTNEDALDDLHDRHYLHDPLGLAVAKMSYLVYSLGEGIIGQVAVTGKHQWMYADKLKSHCWSSSEYCDGWQSQFSAGIK
ncbi:Transcription factor like, partial [Thalictrum thalictroides]